MKSFQLTTVIKHLSYTTLLVGVGIFLGVHYQLWMRTLSPYISDYFPFQKHKKEYHNLMQSANEHCPGLESENAGKDAACEGCPNKNICSSQDPKSGKTVPDYEEVNKKLCDVKKKVLILSGKGGVGKSTVSSQLAWFLQSQNYLVGLLDIDVCGPSIPTMTGSRDQEVHASADGWSPIHIRDNLAVMSVGFLLPQEDDAVIWRGPKKNGLIRQFLTDVQWNSLDILLIDTPPGTSDEHLSIVTYLNPSSIDGALIVSTPQNVALRDVRKEINFCKKVGVPILGVIENMSDSIFSQMSSSAVEEMCQEMSVPYIGKLPLDSHLLQACEEGKSILDVNDKAISVEPMTFLTDYVKKYLHI